MMTNCALFGCAAWPLSGADGQRQSRRRDWWL